MWDDLYESGHGTEFQPASASDQIDRTIQLLFGIGLKLEYSMHLIDESPEQARLGIDSSISNLGQVINELRNIISRQMAEKPTL